MTPDRYEVSASGRRRMSGLITQRGARLGMPTWGGFLFGILFLAAGAFIILVGTKVLAVNPRSVRAPYWVLTVAGASFAFGGFMVWGMTLKQFAANRRRVTAARRYPNEPALADYPWHPDGFAVSEWPGVFKAFAAAAGLTVFLSIFNWWAFSAGGPFMVKAIVSLFDLAALGAWAHAIVQLFRALKFGGSRIDFVTFPFHPPGPVVVRWQASSGINRFNRGTFTLRCIQEWMERGAARGSRDSYVVHEEIWSAAWSFDQPRNFPFREKVELRYEPPAVCLTTDFGAEKPVFWELEVKLDLPGLNFKETYLVPVYGPGQAPPGAAVAT